MFHEIGHMNTGIAYGYRVCSVGVLLLVFFPLGAYVSYNENLNYNKSLTASDQYVVDGFIVHLSKKYAR